MTAKAILIYLAFLVFAVHAQAATTRYVATNGSDSHSCAQAQSQLTPKLTLDSAFSCMASGDTLEVKVGVYAKPTTMPPSGTSWSSPTTIKRFGSDAVTVFTGNSSVVIQNRSYVVWDGINIDATASPDQAVWLGGSHHIRITNSEIYGTNGVTAFGILSGFGNTGSNEIIRNKFHNFGHEYTHHAIYFGEPNNLIEYNEFYAIAGSGVHLYAGTGSMTATSNTIIRYNLFRDSGGFNKSFTQAAAIIAWEGSNSEIYGNVFSNLDGTGFGIVGIGVKVYNNTLYRTRGYAISLEGANHSVRNNIFWDTCFGDPTCADWPFKIYGPGDQSSGSTKSHNLCDATESGCALTSDPMFAAGGFNLQSGSPAIDSGIDVGLPFNGVAPDIGAFESGALQVAKIYYVAKNGSDSNSCAQAQSQSTPKLTLNAAFSCMVSGDTVQVKSGTYAAPTTFPPSGTSESSRTIIQRFGSDVVTLTGSEVLIGSRSYLTFDGFIWNGGGGSNDKIIYIYQGSTRLRFINNEFCCARHAIVDGFSEPSGGNNEIISNKFHNNTGWNPFALLAPAIYLESPNNLVEKNDISQIRGYCIQLYTGSQTIRTDNTVVRFNWCHDSTHEAGKHGGSGINVFSGDNLQIYGNIFTNNASEPSAGAVIGVGDATNFKIYNNTIYNNQGMGINLGEGANNGIVRNNILYQNCQATVSCDWPDPELVDNGVGNIKSNNLTTNPLFVSTADWRLQAGSAAIDTGATLGAPFNLDFAGVTRPQGAGYDLGAYEYTAPAQTVPTPPTNLQVTYSVGE